MKKLNKAPPRNEKGERRCSGYSPANIKPHYVPVEMFSNHSRFEDGLQPTCKSCNKAINDMVNPERYGPDAKYAKCIKDGYQRSRARLDKAHSLMGYYVYLHMDGDEVVYVGKGKLDRAWGFDRTNEEHVMWICEQALTGNQWVKLQITELEEDEAFAIEEVLIDQHQPRFNQLGKQKTED